MHVFALDGAVDAPQRAIHDHKDANYSKPVNGKVPRLTLWPMSELHPAAPPIKPRLIMFKRYRTWEHAFLRKKNHQPA
jgi:hypothetical protein